jgi:hypothetical protein
MQESTCHWNSQACAYHHPLANLAFSTRGGAHTVVVDGTVLMTKGDLRTLDAERILHDCQVRAEKVAARANLVRFSRPQWSVH